MRLLTREITLPFTDLTVIAEYYYYEGCDGDYYNPIEPAEVELTRILVNNCDIMEALSEKTLDAIETYLYENTESDNEQL